MFKTDKVKNLFDCDICDKLLVDPISMACGNNICKSHLDVVLQTETNKDSEFKTFDCELCHEDHFVPKQGFTVNKQIQDCLKIQLTSLKLTPVFDECKREIKEAKENVSIIDSLVKNSDIYVHEFFENIKRNVDLRREDLKVKFDNHSEQVIRSISDSQLGHVGKSEAVEHMLENIARSKVQLDECMEQFDTFVIDEKNAELIRCRVNILNTNLRSIIDEYNRLLVDGAGYSFEFEAIAVPEVFGTFEKKVRKYSAF